MVKLNPKFENHNEFLRVYVAFFQAEIKQTWTTLERDGHQKQTTGMSTQMKIISQH